MRNCLELFHTRSDTSLTYKGVIHEKFLLLPSVCLSPLPFVAKVKAKWTTSLYQARDHSNQKGASLFQDLVRDLEVIYQNKLGLIC